MIALDIYVWRNIQKEMSCDEFFVKIVVCGSNIKVVNVLANFGEFIQNQRASFSPYFLVSPPHTYAKPQLYAVKLLESN